VGADDSSELSSEELELEELELEELELEELDEPADEVELATGLEMTDIEGMAVALGGLSATLDALEAEAPVAVAEITEVEVPLPTPTLPLLADTITKSTQLSYVCFALVPNQNHCSTHSPGTLQSFAARLVGMVTAKAVLLAGRTLSFSSA
jgi:hypothetical protein